MSHSVSVIGVGATRFGERDPPLLDLAAEASHEAIEDAGIGRDEIDSVIIGNVGSAVFSEQATLSGHVVRGLGLHDIPAETVENACSSSSVALRNACTRIAGGAADVVLVVGVEKMTDASTADATRMMSSGYRDIERSIGMTFPGFFGVLMRRYMDAYDVDRETFAQVAVNSHANAQSNPIAQYRDPVTVDEVLNSPPVADPLRLLDCSPMSDGAAAVVLCRAERATEFVADPIDVTASAQTSGYSTLAELFDSEDPTTLRPTVTAAESAYKQAGIGPDAVDLVELHDCFTPAAFIDLEDLGFVPKGTAPDALIEGQTTVEGKIPVNPSGGLLSRGHPIGATGAAQVYEVVKQLRGTAPSQVPNATRAMTHTMGGVSSVAVVHLLQQRGVER